MKELGIEEPERLALRSRDAAKVLGVSERTLLQLRSEGVIPFISILRPKRPLILYPIEVFDIFLAIERLTKMSRNSAYQPNRSPSESWIRVSAEMHCPICGKPDWCLVSRDQTAVICPRVQSPHEIGEAGWLHKLDAPAFGTLVERPATRRPRLVNWDDLARKLQSRCTDSVLREASASLGVSGESLRRLGLGWNSPRKAIAFPMRDAEGEIRGIRYRLRTGAKFAEFGSINGLFFDPKALKQDYLIVVEGASDSAAMMSLGLGSVVGRPNCNSGTTLIRHLCDRLSPEVLIVIPDNDDAGRDGADKLVNDLGRSANLLLLPRSIKDVREVLKNKQAATWLLAAIRSLLGANSISKKGS